MHPATSDALFRLGSGSMRKSNAKHEPAKDAAGAPAAYLSADERRAAGKALRDRTPRAAHGGWKSPEGRCDPVSGLSKVV